MLGPFQSQVCSVAGSLGLHTLQNNYSEDLLKRMGILNTYIYIYMVTPPQGMEVCELIYIYIYMYTLCYLPGVLTFWAAFCCLDSDFLPDVKKRGHHVYTYIPPLKV